MKERGKDANNRKEGGRCEDRDSRSLRTQVAKYFQQVHPKKEKPRCSGALCEPGLETPWTLISWFLHVNYLPPNQRALGVLRSAPLGNPGPRISPDMLVLDRFQRASMTSNVITATEPLGTA
jgi:hypothetical protein